MDDIVIVSASGAEVVEPIGEMLGADRVVATRMEIVDGKYTGTIDYYAYAEEKARAIERLAETVGYDLDASYAYSDSVTDVHMLEVVGHPFAVNPDRELRRIATTNEWPILSFVRPVALRRRILITPDMHFIDNRNSFRFDMSQSPKGSQPLHIAGCNRVDTIIEIRIVIIRNWCRRLLFIQQHHFQA